MCVTRSRQASMSGSHLHRGETTAGGCLCWELGSSPTTPSHPQQTRHTNAASPDWRATVAGTPSTLDTELYITPLPT
jgi:hypothetical protein